MSAAPVDRVTPMFWGIFSVGGFIVAFFLPIFIFMNSLAYGLHLVRWEKVQYQGALGWIRGDPAAALLGGPLAWLALSFVTTGSGISRHATNHRRSTAAFGSDVFS